MTETLASEHELAVFLDTQKKQELATWDRPRGEEELKDFVLGRLDQLKEVL